MSIRRSALLAASSALLLLVSGCGGDDGGGGDASGATGAAGTDAALAVEQTEATISFSAYVPVAVPLWLAQDEGLFEKHGVDVELVYLEGGSTSMQSLLSGSTQMGQSSMDESIATRLRGSDVGIIASSVDGYFFKVYAQPEITSVEDLEGKTLAATRAGSSSEFAIKSTMENAGITDYEIAYVSGGAAGLLSAVQQGSVDATVLPPPLTLQAEDEGLSMVIDLTADDSILGGYSSLNALESWVEENPNTAQALINAYVEAKYLARDEPELAKAAIAKGMDLTDERLIDEAYEAAIAAFSFPPVPNPEAIAVSLEERQVEEGAADADPQDFILDGYVEEAVESLGLE